MNTDKFVLAVISVIDGEIVVDLGNTLDYMTIKTEDGLVCIVERASKEYVPVN